MHSPRRACRPLKPTCPGMRTSGSSASCANAMWCRETATASNSIGRLRRTRRSPGGSGRGCGRRHRIRSLLGLRRFRRAASRLRRGFLPGLVLLFLALVFCHGLAQITLELIEIRLRGHTLVLESRHLLVREIDGESALQRFLELLRVEVIVVVPTTVIERHRHHGSAEQKAHLAARHAFLELRYGIGDEVVALLDVHLVDATRGNKCADGEENCW